MSRTIQLILIVAMLAAGLPAPPALSATAAGSCEDGEQASGALYRICMPEADQWNGDLIVFAHGYVVPDDPLRIPDDQIELPGGTTIPEISNKLGFAFATTSYSTNGLAVRQGIEDLYDLVNIFSQQHGRPERVYLVGGSEGGMITALSVEQFPVVFDGGLAACGPIGDFRRQVNYLGDFRAVFDYFFPGLIPGSPVEVPEEVMANWDSVYAPAVREAIRTDPDKTKQLLRVTHAPIDRHDPESVEETVLGLLWYNVFATNDAIAKLGGQPFDNSRRIYLGSKDDWQLNLQIQRFQADQTALDEIEAHYQTSGRLSVPLVSLHNTRDPFVPYWHVPLYRMKALWRGSSHRHSNIPAFRYGHCNFSLIEGVIAFVTLAFKVSGRGQQCLANLQPEGFDRLDSQVKVTDELLTRCARELRGLEY